MRRADIAWATQMGRESKKRKPLVLIGIACDDEIRDVMDLKSPRDKSKMVFINQSINYQKSFIFLIGCQSSYA